MANSSAEPAGHPTAEPPAPLWRRELRAFAELFALCGFAITQPLLDVFGRNPTQFLFRGADFADAALWALVVTVIPAASLWLVEVAVGLVSPRVRRGIHVALVAALGAAVVLQLLGDVLPAAAVVLAAAAAGGALALARERTAATRQWLAYAAVAPILFLGLFLFGSETARVLAADSPRAVEAGVGNPAPVIVVVFDELPLAALIDSAGELDAELHPNLAALADDAHWFRNATATASSTWYAVPSIVTGQLPRDGTAPVAADHPESLFTLLGGAYDMEVTESVTRLCPPDLCSSSSAAGDPGQLVGDAIDVFVDRVSPTADESDPVAGLVEEPTTDEPATAEPAPDGEDDGFADFGLDQPQRVRALLDGIGTAGDGATLHYLHILLPHVPYRHLPSGLRYPGPDPDLGRDGDDWTDQEWPAALGRQRLQLQMAYVDRLIGELTATLRESGTYDDSLIVLTADHGIAFEPSGPIRGIEGQDLDDGALAQLAWVPLLVKEPGQTEGTTSDANVSTLDVLPTIADVLEIEVPWALDGRSVLGPARDDGTKLFVGTEVGAFGVSAGDAIEVDGPAVWPEVLARGTDRVLGEVGRDDRIWLLGPRPDLVGTDVDAGRGLPVLAAELEDADAYRDVDPARGEVPALVRATLADDLADDDPTAVAVAVDGVVVATARTYVEDGRHRVAAMVPDRALGPGAHTVTLHAIG